MVVVDDYPRFIQNTYVSNRLYQIVTPHTESSNNPADCTSRGVMPSEPAHFSLYWQEPPIIYTDTSLWESSPPPKNIIRELPEARSVVYAARADDVPAEWFARHSIRFGRRSCSEYPNSQRVHFAVLLCELSHTACVSSRSLFKLSPFIDSDSVIRVGDRLNNSMSTHECNRLLVKKWHLAR
ncbi:Uncharacterized protein FWK35_00007216 [Aphis craccivora]|uniref:Uncharacterized protein n=1 Tax=Aphis craccivora TaxID=307492 RepID=A0A6G0Z747_APHCR|nr:Uncharacterized protein FWK35_00007216 [Aphis craccivora]